MDANTTTLEKLFGAPIRYLVPLYQRPYVWSETRQWAPLWSDVQTVAEEWLEHERVGDDPDVRTHPHFLGAIVLEQLASATGRLELRNVIDGQQRLTTLQLFLDAVESAVAELGTQDDRSLLQTLTANDKKVQHHDETYKVWPTNVDQSAFRSAMDDAADASAFADSNLVRCHRFFAQVARNWAQCDPATSPALRLHALTVVLLAKINLVVIDLAADDNPQMIFETLNDRGAPLLAGDLVKNEILRGVMLADGESAMVECYEATWKQFDTEPIWRENVRQGRYTRPRLDVLLFHWVTLRSGQLAQFGQEFLAFREFARTSGKPLQLLAQDLRSIADTDRKLATASLDTAIGRSLDRLERLDAGAVRPVLLFLFNDVQLTDQQRLEAVRTLESWAVRRAICKIPTMGTNRFLVDLISRIDRLGPDDLVDGLRADLAGQTATVGMWPTDEHVTRVLTTMPLYNRINRARVALVLEALEDLRRTSKSEALAPTNLTVEHVLPRGWSQAAWPVSPDDPDGAVRNSLVDHIGNLTLLTASLNSAQSNATWATKRTGLKQSVLRLNRELDELPAWDEDAIRMRSASLAADILRIWPRAESPSGVLSIESATPAPPPVPLHIEAPERLPTTAELERTTAILGHEHWSVAARLIRTWLDLGFGPQFASLAGIRWGLTCLTGGDRLLSVHVSDGDALVIGEDGTVSLALGTPVQGAAIVPKLDAEAEDEWILTTPSISDAQAALARDDVMEGMWSWLEPRNSGALPEGYSNPALVTHLLT